MLAWRRAREPPVDRALQVLDAPVGVPVRSLPAGAEVLVDGQATGLTTPLASLPLEPGTHTIELELADFGAWQGEVTVSPGGGGMDGIDVALTGTVSAYTDKLLPGVEVELDGQPLAEAPVVTGDVPAGMHVVRFRGPGGYSGEGEVPVRVGETAEVVAPMGAAESLGLVTVRGFTVGSTGKSFADGDPIRVDGDAHSATPAEIYLAGGRHTIELEHEGRTLRRVVQVRAGDRRFIDLRIDRLPAISIEHAAPATVEVGSHPLLTATLHGQGAERRRPVFLQVELDGRWTRLAMGQVPGAASTYVVGLPVTSNLAGEMLRYYFTTTDPAGRTADSAIYSVVLR